MPNRCSICGREVIQAALALGFCPTCGNPVGAGVSFAAQNTRSSIPLYETQAVPIAQTPYQVDEPPRISPILPDVPVATAMPQTSRPVMRGAPAHLRDSAPTESPPQAQHEAPVVIPISAPVQTSRRSGSAVMALLIVLMLLVAGVGVLFATGKSSALFAFVAQSTHTGTSVALATATTIPTATATSIPPTATPTPSVPPPPPGYTTFISPDGTYGMNVPSSWQHTSLSANDTVSDSFSLTATGEFVQVTESSVTITPSNIVSYMQSFVAGSNGSAFHITQSAATVTIHGSTWERAQGIFTLNGQGQSIVGQAINAGGHGYVFIYTAPVTTFDTQPGSAYDQIVSSFTFLS